MVATDAATERDPAARSIEAAAEAAYGALFGWIEGEGYRGYDPYDGCNTRYRWLRARRETRLGLTYLHKFSPVNLRPLLGVGKRLNVQGLALITSALLRHAPPGVDADALAGQHLDYVLSRSLIGRYGYHCWNGNDMYVQGRGAYQTPEMPGVIGTDACARAALDYLRRHPERDDLRAVVRSARDFFVREQFQEYHGAAFFRYKPHTPPHACVYNASLVAADYVLAANAFLGDGEGEAEAEAAYRYVLRRQHEDGRWAYAIDLRAGRENHQVDFHQGFVLDALLGYLGLAPGKAEGRDAYLRGLRFYRREQFTPAGQGLYRWPRRWPANIHNQAQGIITFVRAARFGTGLGGEHAGFARTILAWTLRHMRDPQGYFYFLKYPAFTNRIPYMRWGQAWMMNALSHHLADA